MFQNAENKRVTYCERDKKRRFVMFRKDDSKLAKNKSKINFL